MGIDLSNRMLAVAERKNRCNNVKFEQMDASKMRFEEESFDCVTISLGLHDMPLEIRSAVLKEVKRVLKKGGRLFILEYDLPENEIVGSISSRFINIYESKYYLDFVQSDFEYYLKSFGFKLEKKTNYLFHYLRLLQLTQ